jgi:leader peptidase (prepilin peptidase)/N-methyltransferase
VSKRPAVPAPAGAYGGSPPKALARRKFPPGAHSDLKLMSVLALVACGAVAASLFIAPDEVGFFGSGLALLMIGIAWIDARHFIIPDELSAAAFLLALAAAFVQAGGNVAAEIGAALLRAAVVTAAFLVLRLAYHRWRGRQGLGLGDVKLAGVAGAWLDWTMLPVVMEVAAIAALAAALLQHARGRRRLDRTARLPFGLFLAPAIWVCWLAQTLL